MILGIVNKLENLFKYEIMIINSILVRHFLMKLRFPANAPFPKMNSQLQ